MVAKYVSLEWIVSEKTFESGFDGKPPLHAIRNKKTGQYVMGQHEGYYTYHPNQYVLTLESADGEIYHEDIMPYIKYVRHDIRVCKKVRKKIEDAFKGLEFEVEKFNHNDWSIFGIYDIIENALNEF